MDAVLIALVVQDTDAADVAAGTHAAAAADATGEEVVDQRVLRVVGDGAGLHAPTSRGDTHVLVHGLELADTELGAAGAIRWMGGQDKLHGHATNLVRSIGVGVDNHALASLGLAGGKDALLTLNRDGAQAAAANGLKVGMAAEVRNEDAGVQGRLEDGVALLSLYLLAIDRKFQDFLSFRGTNPLAPHEHGRAPI